MNADRIAGQAMARISATVGSDLGEAQLAEVRRIVSELVLAVVDDTARACATRATELYGPQTDLAAGMADEVKRSRVALIANLESMR
jgi:hypothetical protein